MMKFFAAASAIVTFGYFGTFIGWWGLLVIAAIVGFIVQIHGFQSFFSGFLGGAVFFSIYVLLLDSANEGRLSGMMTELLQFDPFFPSVFIGAVLGGLGMLSGKYLRDMISGENKTARYRGKYS